MSRVYALWATAGHVDHGKTALLKALTGVDADRLPEEKKRGITIDIGFAQFEEGGVTVAFVDVPGHEAFVKNMLAGVGGVDAVLLVVAADEAVKPQTVEHLRIADFVGIRRGVIALTKADLVDEETLALAREDVEETVRGTFLEGAPVFSVDAISGRGVAELKEGLLAAARAWPERSVAGLFRLSVDRVFAVKGFGTVVTGSVASGETHEGKILRLLPRGKDVRVRGMEVHGRKSPRARAGERAALNLHGADASEIARGDMLVEGKAFRPSRAFDASVVFLPEAHRLLDARKSLRIRVHHMAAEAMGRLRLVKERGPSSAPTLARVRLESPLPLAAGDRLVLRRFSPVETVGGGIVLDPHPPRGPFREVPAGLCEAAGENLQAFLMFFAARAGERGVALDDAAGRLALSAQEAAALLPPDLQLCGPRLLTRATAEDLRRRVQTTLARFHEENPMRDGMPREALRRAAAPRTPPAAFEALLEAWHKECLLVFHEGIVRLASHDPALRGAAQSMADALEAAFRESGLAPPPPESVWGPRGKDGREAMHYLLKRGALVRVAEDYVVHRDALATLRESLLALAARKPVFDISDFKALTGLSRKHAIPLLEYLDRAGMTVRQGNARKLKSA